MPEDAIVLSTDQISVNRIEHKDTQNPHQTAKMVNVSVSTMIWVTMLAGVAPKRASPQVPRAFFDGDQHDVHDANDPATTQAHRTRRKPIEKH